MSAPAFTDISDERVPAEVVEALVSGEPQRVILTLDDYGVETRVRAAMAAAGEAGNYNDYLKRRREAFDAVKAKVLGALPSDSFYLEQDYPNLPMAVLELYDVRSLEALLPFDEFVRLHPEQFYQTSLVQSLPLINQPAVETAGHTGAGVGVAVLDTGVKFQFAAFGSCTAPGGACKVAASFDTAPEDNKRDDTGHGTNVAGVVLGVAPDAKIIAIDVFTGASASSTDIIEAIDWCVANKATYAIEVMNMSLGGGAYTDTCGSSVFATPIDSARSAGILTVAASGNDGYGQKGAEPACSPSAVSVGAVYDSNIGSVSWSGCTDASTSADKVTCFSNSATWLTVLAPGAMITAATVTQGGTSQASPHVAGAVAVLRELFPGDSLSATVNRITSTGEQVTDARNGRTTPRLDLEAATVDCTIHVDATDDVAPEEGATGTFGVTDPCSNGWTASSNAAWLSVTSGASGTGNGSVGWSASVNTGAQRVGVITVDAETFTVTQDATTATPTPTQPPTPTPTATATPEADAPTNPTVEINGGADYSQSPFVELALAADDDTGVETMCVSNTNSCPGWEAYRATKSWWLNSGNGNRTVSVWFRDRYGNTSVKATDTVYLDSELPREGSMNLTPGDAEIQLDWAGFSDKHSGLAEYVLVSGNRSVPASCDVGTLLYQGPLETFTHTGLTNGTSTYYRLCAVDNADNQTLGISAVGTPAPEFDAPASGTVSINSDDPTTNAVQVSLTLSATDDSTITSVCLSNTNTCTDWQAYNPTKNWTLSGGSGTRTVYVWLRDEWRNATSAPFTDDIVLDTSDPTDGGLTAIEASGQIDLSWTGFSDSPTGVASYKLVYGLSSVPPNCSKGTVAYAGSDSTYSHTTAVNGTTYYYRLCAIDGAGNMSAGATATATPMPESDPPTGGSVSINAGDDYTASAQVTLTLAATDASDVAEMCLSNFTTCSDWLPFNTTKNWNLNSSDGAQAVYAWFRDEWGNTSGQTSDSIVLDKTRPVDGSLNALPGDSEVVLTWGGFSDAGTGILTYSLVYGNKGVPVDCGAGAEIYNGALSTFTDTTVVNGTPRYYRLCAVDRAGNVSAGASASTTPAPEMDAPTGATVTINADDAYANSTNVALTISGTDASNITRMCLSTTTTCTNWYTYSTSKNYNLTVWNGNARVYLWLEDMWGNLTPTPATDNIYMDTTLPTGGRMTLTPGDAEVTLSWSGFKDNESGLASYTVVAGSSSVPTDCTRGRVVYQGTDTSFTDTGLTNGERQYYRVCGVDQAGNNSIGVYGETFPAPEFDGPTGTVIINDDDAYTGTPQVRLTIDATDASTVTHMCVTNATSECTNWQGYNTSKNWSLYAGDSDHLVYVWFRDEWGNVSATPATDSIYSDGTVPTDGRLTLAPGDGEIVLSWSGFNDKQSGIASYSVVIGNSSVPSDCTRGELAYSGPDLTYTDSGLTNGAKRYYRVCAIDQAGNRSLGATGMSIPAPEFDAPTDAAVVINSDDTWSASANVTLDISGTDASDITEMCVSHTNYCPAWEPFRASRTYPLPPADGNATIYVWLRDEWGNETTAPATDLIKLDVTAPTDGRINQTVSDGEVDFSWSGFSDRTSGVDHYKLVFGNKGYPSNCEKGNVVYEGTDLTVTHTALVNDKLYYYRLCAYDLAGNMSYGVVTTATPAAAP